MSSTMQNMEVGDNKGIVEEVNKGKENVLNGKHEEYSKWKNIPNDILENVMKRLKLSDYLRTSAVCSSWKAIYNEANANKRIKPLPELPLVIIESIGSRSVLSIKSEERCSVINIRTGLPDVCHRCRGVVEGWMILSINLCVGITQIIFFLNPITSDIVIVPSPLSFPSTSPISNFNIKRMVASSSPKCEDCVLVCLFTSYAHLAYCRVNYDKTWTMIEAGEHSFADMEILNGKLYVRTDTLETCILVYDLKDCTDKPPKPIVLGEAPQVRPFVRSIRCGNQTRFKDIVIQYIAKGYASEELLLIYLFYDYVYENDNDGNIKVDASYDEVTECEVFKLETESNEWVKLDDLGDRVIFVARNNSFVMSRTLLNCSEEIVRENSVYFALVDTWKNIVLGRLCLSDNNVKNFSLEELGVEYHETFWFLPSVW